MTAKIISFPARAIAHVRAPAETSVRADPDWLYRGEYIFEAVSGFLRDECGGIPSGALVDAVKARFPQIVGDLWCEECAWRAVSREYESRGSKPYRPHSISEIYNEIDGGAA